MWAELIIVWLVLAVILALIVGGFMNVGGGPRH